MMKFKEIGEHLNYLRIMWFNLIIHINLTIFCILIWKIFLFFHFYSYCMVVINSYFDMFDLFQKRMKHLFIFNTRWILNNDEYFNIKSWLYFKRIKYDVWILMMLIELAIHVIHWLWSKDLLLNNKKKSNKFVNRIVLWN